MLFDYNLNRKTHKWAYIGGALAVALHDFNGLPRARKRCADLLHAWVFRAQIGVNFLKQL
jgi:hypothetical protein